MNDPMPSEGASLDMNYPMFKLLHGNWSASASLGAMRALVGKLDMLLLVRSQGFSSKRVKDGMRLLKDDVEELSSYLDELSEVEDPPPIATCWMNEVRDLSYDMEDYIDSLLFMPPGRLNCNKHNKKHKKRKKKNKKLITSHVKIPKRLKWCKRITYVSQVSEHGNTRSVCRNIHVMIIARPLPKRPKNIVLPEMISRFKTYIQDAIERHDRYLHCCSTLRRRRFLSTSCMVPTPPYDEAAEIVIDSRMSEFINSQSLAVNEVADQQHLKVVSILGPGCLGKTTLARVLYNRIGMQFDCRAFIRVSKKPDMKRLFCDLFSQLHQKKEPLPANCDELGSSDNISKHLQSKRYLIVIDDLWDASVWNIIKYAFPEDKHGSRIIITTQIEDVAIACCCDHPEQVFEMKPLDNDHSRKLFFNRLFGSESDCPAEFKQVSNEIVDICGGLPLATINIASQLANQPTAVSMDLLAYTNDLLRSYLWSNSTSERTRRVLNLSYNNLPHYLKTCLLYLSMYSAGSIICKDDLVKQWVAEGFIPTREWNVEDQDMMEEAAGMYFDEQDQYMMEKAAGMYFDELIDRRFIQPFHINYNNKVLSCTVHDMVRDLIAQKCAEDDFIVAVDYNRKNIALSHKVRRLSLVFGDAKYAKTPSNIIKSQVRSLRFFGLFDCMPCIREFKILRVLNLQLSNHLGDHDPIDLTGISDLYQLRYLKIAGDVCIKLPNHMRGLKCLETLDVMDATRLTDVPWDIIYLPHLLHLSLPVGTDRLDWIGSMSDSVISQWSIGKLNYLQDLHLTSSSTHPSYHMERSMEALRSLIGGHYNLKTVIVAHSSSAKKTLVRGASKVIITWDDLKPPPLLQRFEFTLHSCCMFSQIPPWVEKHGNLCILKIPVRLLDMAYVDILGGLRALTDLSLYVETAPIDKIIFSEEGFSILKYFKLRFLTGIACLKFETDAMPSLLKLKLVFNAIPPMGQPLFFRYGQVRKVKHQCGTAVVSIEHMPSLNEVSVKFGGATADLEYASRTFVCNHPKNPRINTQLVDYSSYGDASTKQKQPYEIPEEEYWTLEKDSDGISEEEPDGIVEEEPDGIVEEEPDRIVEEEPDRIVVEEQAEPSKEKKRKNKMNIYDNKLQRLAGPADKRISMSPEGTSLTLRVNKGTSPAGEETPVTTLPIRSRDPANPPAHIILRRGDGSLSVMADDASSSGAGAGAGGHGGVGESVVIDYGRRRTTCGYCRSTGPTSISHGLWATSLKADDYQALLDRGWRRSGSFLYKPEMDRTCCPAYTIRLKASDFICSKEQDRVLRRMQRFLDGELDPQVGSAQCKTNPTKRSLNEPMNSPTLKVSRVSAYEFQTAACQSLDKKDEFICCLSSKINEAIDACFQGGIVGSDVQLPKAVVKTVKPQVKKKVGEAAQEKKGDTIQDLVYTCSISFQLAATIRRTLPEEKRAVLGDLSPNYIAEKLVLTMAQHGEVAGFSLKACNGHLNFYSATIQAIQNHTSVGACAQASDKSNSSKQNSVEKNDARHNQKAKKLEFRMARSHFDPEEFALYKRYQTKVHKEKTVTESSYKRFLVDTPIVSIPPVSGDNTVPPCGFGSFHQQYRIDGKLVAVGVVDILPKCLSSKYLFWDPDLAFLSLGKYTALKEIDWVKTTRESCPSLQYYYLGYYIHSCNKMRYKAAYRPSELLCPVRYEWVCYDAAKPLLDKSLYSVLSDFSTSQDEMPQPHTCGPCNESSAKNDHCDIPIDEDDEDSDYDESEMMVDEEMVHSESKTGTTEDCLDVHDIENVIMDLNGARVKYKELQSVVGPIERRHLSELERQLSRYVKVVGKELSDRMVYCLS